MPSDFFNTMPGQLIPGSCPLDAPSDMVAVLDFMNDDTSLLPDLLADNWLYCRLLYHDGWILESGATGAHRSEDDSRASEFNPLINWQQVGSPVSCELEEQITDIDRTGETLAADRLAIKLYFGKSTLAEFTGFVQRVYEYGCQRVKINSVTALRRWVGMRDTMSLLTEFNANTGVLLAMLRHDGTLLEGIADDGSWLDDNNEWCMLELQNAQYAGFVVYDSKLDPRAGVDTPLEVRRRVLFADAISGAKLAALCDEVAMELQELERQALVDGINSNLRNPFKADPPH